MAHLVGTGSSAVVIEVPNNYEAIGSIVGVNKLTGSPPEGADGASIAEGIRDGRFVKIRISYKDNNKRKSSYIICELSKVKTALRSLKGKQYAGREITGANLPTRRRFV